MDEAADAWWGQGCTIKIKETMELGVGRQLWIDSGPTQKIEGQDCLRQQAVPQMEGKVFVTTAKASDKMIFERADCTFSSIATVDARRN
jgi:hypothetical protein